MFIRVRGTDSDAFTRANDELQQRRMARLPQEKPTPESIREDALELSASLVAGWPYPGSFEREGEQLPYTAFNARLLLRQYPWIREQVEGFAQTRANFLLPSASSSPSTPATSAA